MRFFSCFILLFFSVLSRLVTFKRQRKVVVIPCKPNSNTVGSVSRSGTWVSFALFLSLFPDLVFLVRLIPTQDHLIWAGTRISFPWTSKTARLLWRLVASIKFFTRLFINRNDEEKNKSSWPYEILMTEVQKDRHDQVAPKWGFWSAYNRRWSDIYYWVKLVTGR